MANQFELDFEEKFPSIRKKCKAFLYRLYPKMRCIGMRGTMPAWILVGRALFDVAGWLPVTLDGQTVAQNIGIELKDTKQRHTSLKIVGADGSGSGVQAHQLEALAAVHRDGGVACILWSNGGITGVLDGQYIRKSFYDYGVSLQAEKMGKTPAKGARSIPWSLFREVDLDETPERVIVPPPKALTLQESLDAKRKKASKQIEKAQREDAERIDAEGFLPALEEDEDGSETSVAVG
jgi:hypothetical protein